MAKKRTEEKKPREYTKRQLSSFKKQQRRQRTIFISGISVLAIIALLIASGWFFGEYYPLNKTIVKVYDAKIKQSALIDTMVIVGSSQQGVDLQAQADYILNAMVQNELSIRKATEMGITASDEEIEEQMKSLGYPDNTAARTLAKVTVMLNKLVSDHLEKQVPDSGSQVQMNAMLVESEEVAQEIKEKLLAGEDYKALAAEYAMNLPSQENQGVFDWHPAEVLITDIGSSIPVDWAFKPETIKGDISGALSDNTSSKQMGYWLLKVTDRREEEAAVWGLLLSSEAEAEKVKPLLESTDNISALVDEYSDYSPSVQGHGDLGVVAVSQNISAAFNDYVFNPDNPVGEWSGPVKDDRYWTKGGAWIVQLIDKEESRAYTEEDKNVLVNNAYTQWTSQLWLDTAADIANTFTDEQKQWAIERATKKIRELQLAGG